MPIGLNNDTFTVNLSDESVQQIGSIIASTRHIAPTGYLLCDGSNTVSRTTFANLFNVIVPSKGTITITSANPGVVTLNSHGFLTGESVYLTTTGTLPTNLTANTLYYVINISPTDTANTFRLATTYANAIAGTAINTTAGTQSPTHTLFYCPYGLGSNTSNFKLPDFKSAYLRGRGLDTIFTQNRTTGLGEIISDQFQGHRHSVNELIVFGGSYPAPGGGSRSPSPGDTSSPISDGTNGTPRTGNETRPNSIGVNYFIKF